MSKRDLLQALSERHRIIRWGVYYLLVLLMFLFGQFGSEDFIYLAAIESYLNPRAVSPAKAAGLWQL